DRQVADVFARDQLVAFAVDFEDGRSGQADEDGDDRNDHQHLDEREAGASARWVIRSDHGRKSPVSGPSLARGAGSFPRSRVGLVSQLTAAATAADALLALLRAEAFEQLDERQEQSNDDGADDDA